MTAFLLGAFKIILLTLAIILGVVALLMAIVLFVPFCYEAQVNVPPPHADVRLKWLLGALTVRYAYGGGERIRVRALAFTVYDSGKKKAAKKATTGESVGGGQTTARKPGERAEELPDAGASPSSGKPAKKKPRKQKAPKENTGKKKGEGRKNALQAAKEALSYTDEAKAVIPPTRKLVKRLFRALMPKKLCLRGVVGFDSPDVTGLILGLVGACVGITSWDIELTGSFDRPVMEGGIYVKGRIFLFSLLWPFAAYVFAMPVWRIIRTILFKRKGDRA